LTSQTSPINPNQAALDEVPPGGYYRRPLPSHLVAFSSAEGRTIFREALLAVREMRKTETETERETTREKMKMFSV
jgi:hypothetical protein